MPALFRDAGYTALKVRGAHSGHVIAYLRRHESGAIVVLAARLFATLDGLADRSGTESEASDAPRRLPVGAPTWGDTAVQLPESARACVFEDRLTGARAAAEGGWLALSEVFRHFPGAVLVSSSPQQ